MNIYEQNTHAHSVGWNTWHFQWCTKYRYKVFKKEKIKNFCFVAITEAAQRHKIGVVDMEIDIDHVHVIADLPMTMDPTKALHLLKGFSARLMFSIVPRLRKTYPRGHLWSLGKFAASVGYITLENAKKYLDDHHAKALLPERESPPFRAWEDVNFVLQIPYFFLKPKFSGEHYWGLGIKGISKKVFRNHANKANLNVIKEFSEQFNPHHYFFIMKKF